MSSNGIFRVSAATICLFATFSQKVAPAQMCSNFELVGDVHPTALSGYKGKTVLLGDPNSGSQALWGLYSKETSWTTNDPCWVKVARRSVNDTNVEDSPTPANFCGTKKPQDDTFLSADFATNDLTGPRVFVNGVSVCLNREGDKIKGWKLYGKKINDNGTLTDTNNALAGPRANCPADGSGWRPAVRCAADELATAAEIHFGPGSDERDWIGIELKCRTLKVHGAISATSVSYPTQPAPFQALKVDSDHVLVSVTGSKPGVQVLGGDTLKSSCVNAIPSAPRTHNVRLAPGSADIGVGIDLAGIAFLSTDDVLHCRNPAAIVVDQGYNPGTLDVAFTLDGKFAFVLNERGAIGVLRIERDVAGHIGTGTRLLNSIQLDGSTNAGMTLSPDGKRLYVSSEVVNGGVRPPGMGDPILYDAHRCRQGIHINLPTGLLTVIDVAKATREQTADAIIGTIAAGCGPTRILVTADGSTLWVSARDDNRVLAFGARELESRAGDSLLGYASTEGDAPVGLGFIHNEKFLVVANSNRFDYADNRGTTNAVIMDVSKPAAPKMVCQLQTGDWPREVAVGSDGATVYLTNYASAKLQVISTIPTLAR